MKHWHELPTPPPFIRPDLIPFLNGTSPTPVANFVKRNSTLETFNRRIFKLNNWTPNYSNYSSFCYHYSMYPWWWINIFNKPLKNLQGVRGMARRGNTVVKILLGPFTWLVQLNLRTVFSKCVDFNFYILILDSFQNQASVNELELLSVITLSDMWLWLVFCLCTPVSDKWVYKLILVI
jgi:hypothetical protein